MRFNEVILFFNFLFLRVKCNLGSKRINKDDMVL